MNFFTLHRQYCNLENNENIDKYENQRLKAKMQSEVCTHHEIILEIKSPTLAALNSSKL